MGKKTTERIRQDLCDIEKYKWEFLRRNEQYISDCEKWSGRKHSQWNKKEIILGYESKGKIDFEYDLQFKAASDALWKYYEKYCMDWYGLTIDTKEEERLKKKGLRSLQTPLKYTWGKYRNKWSVNLPLNPKCNIVPFFVSIAPAATIIQNVNGEKIENDIVLERGTVSWIGVNWAMHKDYLELLFKKILDGKQMILTSRNILQDKRTPLAMYDTYLAIWDMKNDKSQKYTFVKIAEKVYPQDAYENLDSTIERVKKNYKETDRLVKGGYKEIGIRGT